MKKQPLAPSDFGVKWTPTAEYPKIVAEANQRYGFGFSEEELRLLSEKLIILGNQPDSLKPISVALWPKGTKRQNIDKLIIWLIDRAKEIEGLELNITSLLGMNPTIVGGFTNYGNSPFAKPIILDLRRERVECSNEDEDGSKSIGQIGIELLVFMCLNPQVIKAMKKKPIGPLRAPGLLFNKGKLMLKLSYKKCMVIHFLLKDT